MDTQPRTRLDRLLGRSRVPTVALPVNHVLLVDSEGIVRDLGPCTIEDLALTAHVAEQAYAIMRSKRTPVQTLSRVRGFTRRLYSNAKSP